MDLASFVVGRARQSPSPPPIPQPLSQPLSSFVTGSRKQNPPSPFLAATQQTRACFLASWVGYVYTGWVGGYGGERGARGAEGETPSGAQPEMCCARTLHCLSFLGTHTHYSSPQNAISR